MRLWRFAIYKNDYLIEIFIFKKVKWLLIKDFHADFMKKMTKNLYNN